LPNDVKESSLSQILQAQVPRRYYLSKTACLGILRRARERGKELPPQLKRALEIQAGVAEPDGQPTELEAYHINQRDEGIPLGGVSGALMATSNMQMQTFVTDSSVAFAANQRDEVRDLHDVAGALGAQPGMKQQTFIAEGCLTPWDTQQERIFSPDGKAPTLAGADGGGRRNPAGLLFAAGFCAGAGPSAGGIGYCEEVAPTLKGAAGGNMMPSILCLNDQGGKRMDLSHDISGTLRADEKGHQPLVMATQQGGAEIGEGVCPTITAAAGASGNNQPVLFENHGIDSRYTGPHEVAPTMSARYGTGGNNVPLVSDDVDAICIAGNIIDRQPENGGNGLGCQPDIAYTLTATDHHAVFSRQRVDVFKDDEVASTQSARQHKDATDLVCQPTYQETVGTIGYTDHKGVNNQFVSEDKCIVERRDLIRRLTPLECERLQGFPDHWTDIPGASDSARYKALGNSVAIPCVEFVLRGIALVLRKQEE
jgi:DNA (cytosine-5)-methyltransferase 1